jgi:hypothetical protein
MKYLASRTVWGILLIAGGIIFLLQNMKVIYLGDLFWAAVFVLAALPFFSVSWCDRRQWWGLIPGMVLLSIAAIIFLNFAFPAVEGQWGGMVFLGGIGLAFFLIYFFKRANWWAIIPGGVLFTLAFIAGFAEMMQGIATGGVFFLGLGLTFILVAILPNPEGQMKWAFIPGGILTAIGLIMAAFSASLFGYVWPAALILLGLYLILRVFIKR